MTSWQDRGETCLPVPALLVEGPLGTCSALSVSKIGVKQEILKECFETSAGEAGTLREHPLVPFLTRSHMLWGCCSVGYQTAGWASGRGLESLGRGASGDKVCGPAVDFSPPLGTSLSKYPFFLFFFLFFLINNYLFMYLFVCFLSILS